MLLLGVNIYSPAGFVNVSSGIGTDLSLISYILLPVRTLNVVLSPLINILSLGSPIKLLSIFTKDSLKNPIYPYFKLNPVEEALITHLSTFSLT